MPDTKNMVHTESTHPFHVDLYKTMDLLSLETINGKVYFVVEGLCTYKEDREEPQETPDNKYFYEEHSCPTNFIRCARIIHNKDSDPHGLFKYERSLWMTPFYNDGDNLAQYLWIENNFPELGMGDYV